MIEQTKFLGMPLKTQRQRRLVVALYYALLVILNVAWLWLGKNSWKAIFYPEAYFYQALILGIRLWQIQRGGLVHEARNVVTADGVQTLNIQGRRAFGADAPLDERERMQRDHAHYNAYRILSITVAIAFTLYFVGLVWAPRQFINMMPTLLWSFFIYALSLPQAVVLWTEPQAPAEELAEVGAGIR